MIMKNTVQEYKDILKKTIRWEYASDLPNKSKFIRAYRNAIARLEWLDNDIVITVESANGLRGKAQGKSRGFDIPNLGSLMECTLKSLLDKEPSMEYEKEFSNDKADCKVGWCEYEIKACMGTVSRNTPIQGDKPILLINECGIFSIKKDDIKYYVDKNGKLPFNETVGKMWTNLMNKCGYEI